MLFKIKFLFEVFCFKLLHESNESFNAFSGHSTVPVATTLYLPILTDAETYIVNGVEKKFADGKVCYCGKCLKIELQPGSYTFVQK